jgi:hypothetical protein
MIEDAMKIKAFVEGLVIARDNAKEKKNGAEEGDL